MIEEEELFDVAKTTIKLAGQLAGESELGVKISNSLALEHGSILHVIIYRPQS